MSEKPFHYATTSIGAWMAFQLQLRVFPEPALVIVDKATFELLQDAVRLAIAEDRDVPRINITETSKGTRLTLYASEQIQPEIVIDAWAKPYLRFDFYS